MQSTRDASNLGDQDQRENAHPNRAPPATPPEAAPGIARSEATADDKTRDTAAAAAPARKGAVKKKAQVRARPVVGSACRVAHYGVTADIHIAVRALPGRPRQVH